MEDKDKKESSWFDEENPSNDDVRWAKQSLYYHPETQSQFCILMDRHKHELKEARAEVIEQIKIELLKLVSGSSDPEPYIEFNAVMDILDKLSRGAE